MSDLITLDPLLREHDVAKQLDVSIYVIRRLRASGKLRSLHVGKEVRVRQSAVMAYLAEQEAECHAPTAAPVSSEKPAETNGMSSVRSTAGLSGFRLGQLIAKQRKVSSRRS